MTAHLFQDRNGAIVVAGCNTPDESDALLRWILPVLEEWPPQTWRAWISETPEPGKVRAAMMTASQSEPKWRDVDAADFAADGPVCRTLGGGGLVILTHDTIATHVMRSLEGLAARLTCFATSDPLAQPFKRSFASFGV